MNGPKRILLNRRKILEGTGKISHEEAIKKAEKEFQIYREREMKELLENDKYDFIIDNNGSIEDLFNQVKNIAKELE